MAPPDAEVYETQRRRIEELKAELGTLRYTISSHKQEQEMARLEHEGELRDVRRRAEEDFNRIILTTTIRATDVYQRQQGA